MQDFIFDKLLTIDGRDVFYATGGLAFFGLTFLPILKQSKYLSVPTIYVLVGAILALSPYALPFIDPRAGGLQLSVIEHASELIVIVSLAGAGLAVDRRMGLKSWASAWRLLTIAMPLTIVAITWLSMGMLGLPLATALLLGACLAPTDPVLARSVQVSGPGQEDDEHEVQVALTAEAGLNDGLAFPFVYFAIGLAGLSATADGSLMAPFTETGRLLEWFAYDLVYRVGVGAVVGMAVGWAMSSIVYSGIGDAKTEQNNSGLTLMAATFISYGVTEMVSGYGFLAVFIAARAARHYARVHHEEGYEEQPHHFADQVEGLLMALLLLWFGALLVNGTLTAASPTEWAFAALLVFGARPIAGLLALIGRPCTWLERGAIAFFGIRGMGSVFYLAYGQNHAEFAQMDTAWRVAALTILISIIVHGASAPVIVGLARRRDGLTG